MSFIIFDTEYTSWKGCQENGWTGNQKKEIVQIGAIKVSENMRVVAKFNELCRPVVNPVLSDYFVNLTRITNEMVQKDGHPFPETYERFKKFAGNSYCFSHSWGSSYYNKGDGSIIEENLRLHNLPLESDMIYRNVAHIFKRLYKKYHIDIKNQTSGQIVKLLHLEKQQAHLHLDEHNALFDAYSILTGLKYFRDDVFPLIKKLR